MRDVCLFALAGPAQPDPRRRRTLRTLPATQSPPSPRLRLWVVDVRFYVDPTTDEPHLVRHGVSEAEARQALEAREEDRPGAEGSRVAVGRTEAGRYLRVIYVPDPDRRSIFVVTAYELTGKALWAFRRRRRRKR